jgi:serine/threonine-protein kinase HipA
MRREAAKDPGQANVERITLYYEGTPVATVEATADPGRLSLTYLAPWLERADRFPISTRFPLSQAQYEGADVYIWFLNLLPEDDALKTVGRILNVSMIDVVGLIAALGGDLPGALTALPERATIAARQPSWQAWTEAKLAADIRRLPERPLLVGEEGVHMSLAGQQIKLPVLKLDDGRLALPLDGQPSTHILKPASPKLRASVENEAYCLRLAARSGLKVAEAEIGRAEDITYLMVRRYDRVIEGERIRRLHQEDLCQALGEPPFQKYEWNPHIRRNGPSIRELIEAVSHGRYTATNRLALLDAIVFNILICNVDSHAKNYSLLQEVQGATMAPLYDLMCERIYDGITENLPQKIADQQRGDHIYRRHWERFAKETGFAPAPTVRRATELAERVLANVGPLAEAMCNETPASGIVLEIAATIEARCHRVLENSRKE